jgi:hypothetical protein
MANPLIDIGTSVLGSRSKRKAAKQAAEALNTATGIQAGAAQTAQQGIRGAFGEYQAGLSPYADYGAGALDPLTGLLGGGDSARQAALGGGDVFRQGIAETQNYDPSGLRTTFAGGDTARAGAFGGAGNQVFQNAIQQSQAYDPTSFYSADIYNNPLLKGSIDEAQKRLSATQAARGQFGSGNTARGLQEAISGQAINLAGILGNAQRQNIQDNLALGSGIEDLRQRDLGNILGFEDLNRQARQDRLGVGAGLEDLRRADINDQTNRLNLGVNLQNQLGTTGLNVAGDLGRLGQEIGDIRASNVLGRAQADNTRSAARYGLYNDLLGVVGNTATGALTGGLGGGLASALGGGGGDLVSILSGILGGKGGGGPVGVSGSRF